MRIFISFLLAVTFVNAQEIDSRRISINSDFIDSVRLGQFNQTNSDLYLTIESSHDECGEWGGHYEIITIKSNTVGELFADYKKYGVSCDSVSYYNQRKKNKIKPIQHKKVKLDDNKLIAIKEFSLELLLANFSEIRPGHSGKFFKLKHRDNFTIEYSDYFGSKGFINVYDSFLEKLGVK
ncbi:hypothetical protein G5B37_03320 [Rasiella rasia]|uniref:Uncharacterized protein n=1 Tax=Rasiella rasia TaxID=2744027 RepID=A0A6G6GJM9_9FLAO|nr:hypothetical protein [Rasiella rasia]QIE58623.1 hypothetical protein G5B37_03320 [Rasiella rasia]